MGEGSGIGRGGWGEEGRVEIGREGFSDTEEELWRGSKSVRRRVTGGQNNTSWTSGGEALWK